MRKGLDKLLRLASFISGIAVLAWTLLNLDLRRLPSNMLGEPDVTGIVLMFALGSTLIAASFHTDFIWRHEGFRTSVMAVTVLIGVLFCWVAFVVVVVLGSDKLGLPDWLGFLSAMTLIIACNWWWGILANRRKEKAQAKTVSKANLE